MKRDLTSKHNSGTKQKVKERKKTESLGFHGWFLSHARLTSHGHPAVGRRARSSEFATRVPHNILENKSGNPKRTSEQDLVFDVVLLFSLSVCMSLLSRLTYFAWESPMRKASC